MEEKESALSGSPENTESGSPTPISFVGVGGNNSSAAASVQPTGDLGAVIPPSVAVSGGGGSGESTRKKRGRPRKYDAEGNLSYAYAAAAARRVAAEAAVSTPPGFSLTSPTEGSRISYEYGSGSTKRGRGKHSASSSSVGGPGQWHSLAALGEILADTAGADFTPHVLDIQTGEDIAAKIHSFGQKGPRGICVLSAIGPVSSVTIRQPGSSGGLLTYEGRFEILSLTGSYMISETGGVTTRNGGLSITLAGPDGRVVGGSVAGWITAADPILLVLGSFVPNGHKAQKRKYHRESPTTVMNPVFSDAKPAEIPNPQPLLHHEAGPPAVSPLRAHSLSEADDSIGSGHNLNVVSSHNTPEWNNGSEPQKLYPDINVSVPGV